MKYHITQNILDSDRVSQENNMLTVWECQCPEWYPAPWSSDCQCPSPTTSVGSSPALSCNLLWRTRSVPAAPSRWTYRDLSQCYCYTMSPQWLFNSITFSSIWEDKRWNAMMVVTSNGRNFHLKWKSTSSFKFSARNIWSPGILILVEKTLKFLPNWK